MRHDWKLEWFDGSDEVKLFYYYEGIVPAFTRYLELVKLYGLENVTITDPWGNQIDCTGVIA